MDKKIDDMFSYKIPTTPGQSGRPVIMEIAGDKYICGIHQCADDVKIIDGKKVTNKNWCTKINKKIINKIIALNESLKSQMQLNNNESLSNKQYIIIFLIEFNKTF